MRTPAELFERRGEKDEGDGPARLLSRTETKVSPWVRLVEKGVQFAAGGPTELYHSIGVADYVAIVAVTRSGLIPVVRQYRPAVEAYTWELPGGLVDAGERPEVTCRRELREETGIEAETVTSLGVYFPDTGRLDNRQHNFLVRSSDPTHAETVEAGVIVKFVDVPELRRMIRDGRFRHLLHLGALMSASVDSLEL